MPHSKLSLVIDIIIPARDQAQQLRQTLADIPFRLVRSAVVVDNGSRDTTASVARDAGAVVLREPRVGYGTACRRAIGHLESLPKPPDVVVFMAADGTDDPRDISALVEPIRSDNAELVIGVRKGGRTRSPHSRAVLGMIGAIYRHRFDDVGPFRAVRFPALIALALRDPSMAFHVEMQVKAITMGLHIAEVPVQSRVGHNGASVKRAVDSLQTTSRAVFHILRHSTIR